MRGMPWHRSEPILFVILLGLVVIAAAIGHRVPGLREALWPDPADDEEP